jgi:hypothetical protein
MPDQDVVVAITSSVGDMLAVLTSVWEHLMPTALDPLKEDPDSLAELQSRLQALAIQAPEGSGTSDMAGQVSGIGYRGEDEKGRTFRFEFSLKEEGVVLAIDHENNPGFELRAGYADWVDSTVNLDGDKPIRVSARGAWTTRDSLVLVVKDLNSPAGTTISTEFNDGHATLRFQSKGRFAPEVGPVWKGTV